MAPKNQWICTAEKTILTSPVMEVIERSCQSSEDNRTHSFFLLKSNDWCNIIPITDKGTIVLVKQFRIGINTHTLEIPGGVVDSDDTDPQSAAVRELIEETGYVPRPNARCQSLGWTFPNPAIQNNRVHFFMIGPVCKEKPQDLDKGELIETVEVSIEKFIEKLVRGEIKHALILNAFLHLLLQSNDALKILQSQLSHPAISVLCPENL